MQFFRAARFNVERFFEDETFQQAYVEALTSSNPILASSMLCGHLHGQLNDCYMRHGRDSEQCSETLVNTLACASSVFAPREFQVWKDCVDGKGGSEGCGEEMQGAMEASEDNYSEAVSTARDNFVQDAKTVEEIKKCGFPGNSGQEAEFNQVLQCMAPVTCPNQLKSFLDCVEKNDGLYDAPACKLMGASFARCFGANMAEAAMRVEME